MAIVRRHVVAYVTARPAASRTTGVLGLIAVAVVLAIQLPSLYNDARQKHQQAVDDHRAAAVDAQGAMGQRFAEATALAASVAAFGAGSATFVPDHVNGTLASRLLWANNLSWPFFARDLFESVPGVQWLILQPSGVVSHTYPVQIRPGSDTLNSPTTSALFDKMITTGRPVVQGPLPLGPELLYIAIRYPVYLGEGRSLSTWWGAGTVIFYVGDLVERLGLASNLTALGFDLWVYAQNEEDSSDIFDVVHTRNDTEWFGSHGITAPFEGLEGSDRPLYISVAPREAPPGSKPTVAAVAVQCVVAVGVGAGVVLVLALLIAVGWAWRHRHVPHRRTRPQDTLMALVSVKKLSGWTDAADEDAVAARLAGFETTVRGLAASHGCYPCGRVSDGCCMVVARSPEAVRSFATAAMSLSVPAPALSTKNKNRKLNHETASFSTSHQRSTRSRRTAKPLSISEESMGTGTTPNTSQHYGSRQGDCVLLDLQVGVSVHLGALGCRYCAETDRFLYHGGGVGAAALAVDSTPRGEVSVTNAFAMRHAVAAEQAIEVVTLEDGSTFLVVESTWRAAGDEQSASKDDEDRAVATMVSSEAGTVLRKRVAVLLVDLHCCSPETVLASASLRTVPSAVGSGAAAAPTADATKTAEALGVVAMVAAEHRGEVMGFHGTTACVVFNARLAASGALGRAAATDLAIRAALPQVQVLSVVAHGHGYVTTVAGQLACVGPVVAKAKLLMAAVAVAVERAAQPAKKEDCGVPAPPASGEGAPPPHVALRSCLADSSTAENLRQSHELMCVGPVAPYRTLVYAVEREWEAGAEHEEWLYKVQQLEEASTYNGLNRAFEAFHAGNVDVGRELATAVLNGRQRATVDPAVLAVLRALLP